jgi:hypothetical protein
MRMHSSSNRSNRSLDDVQVQRLVDGELSAEEYRALLAGLDEEPGGWRRCAMAFLEAQALTQELSSVRRTLDLRGGSDGKAAKPTPVHIAQSGFEVRTLVAVAASFLVAFALGVFIPRFWTSARQDSSLVGNLTTQRPGLNPAGMADNNELPWPTARQVGSVQLVMDGPGGAATAAEQVPVYDVGQDLEQYLSAEQPTLGLELIELLRQQGYDVQHQQQYFPAPLNDGRQIIVPVDGYRITPVSRRF